MIVVCLEISLNGLEARRGNPCENSNHPVAPPHPDPVLAVGLAGDF
jgi:hypothetical protein